MVDKAKLDQMLSNLRRYVEVLKGLAATPKDAFLGSADRVGNAKYHFVIAIECCIDIANHVIASERLRIPRDNAESFAVLCEAGVVPAGRRASLEAMARFRNRLVHLYWEVDDQRVFEYLGSSLDDFSAFAEAVGSFSGGRRRPSAS